MTETAAYKGNAFAFIHDKKYWLHVNDKIFIFQYNLIHSGNGRTVYPWIKWTLAHNPTCFNVKDGYMYFGGQGNLYKFDPSSVSDDGTAIDAYWYSKKTYLKYYDLIKLFTHLYLEFRSVFGNTTVDIAVYINDINATTSLADIVLGSFWNPNEFNPNSFNPNATNFISYTKRVPINVKGQYFQYRVKCDTLNQAFTLISSKLQYALDRRVI
jgi:hypothetical protein